MRMRFANPFPEPDNTPKRWDLLRSMSYPPDPAFHPVHPPRHLSTAERAVIEDLLSAGFVGGAGLLTQLECTRVTCEGAGDTRTIALEVTDQTLPAVVLPVRIPVEGEVPDEDGTAIAVLLHVIDGYLHELEIYRVDGREIMSRSLGALSRVTVNPAVER